MKKASTPTEQRHALLLFAFGLMVCGIGIVPGIIILGLMIGELFIWGAMLIYLGSIAALVIKAVRMKV